MIEAPRRGDDPLAARTAFDRSAEQCAAVSTRAVLLEVVAVAVVQAGQIDVLGGGQPAAGFVVDEDAADPLPVVLARLKESLDLGQCAGARSADLYAIDHTGEDGVRKFEHVLGVLGERTGQIGHVHFRVSQVDLASFPFPPSAQGEDGNASQRDKARDP